MENSETQKYANSVSDQGQLDPQERLRRLREIQLPNERKIIKHPDFEIAWPERVSTIGFVVITLICAAILFGTWFIGKLIASL
jgi:hypothetical protein